MCPLLHWYEYGGVPPLTEALAEPVALPKQLTLILSITNSKADED